MTSLPIDDRPSSTVMPRHLRPVSSDMAQYLLDETTPGSLFRIGVPGEGSCFYHSVACATFPTEWFAAEPVERAKIGYRIRNMLSALLTSTAWKRFLSQHENLPDLIKDHRAMRRLLDDKKAWAEISAIQFLMSALRTSIIFVDTETNRLYCGAVGSENAPSHLVLLWVNRSHFETLALITPEGKMQTCFSPDHPFIQRIRHLYTQVQCPA